MITETNVANRGLQRIGGKLIAASTLWTENSKNAAEVRESYDILRRSELRRNVWRFSIRTVILRALETTTKLITFPTWSTLVQYEINDIVLSNGQLWIATVANIAVNPTLRSDTTYASWQNYIGADIADVWDDELTYMTGELVYSGADVYFSLVNNNEDNAVSDTDFWQQLTVPTYAGGTTYGLGARVISSGTTYVSIQAANIGHTPVSSPTWWTAVSVRPTIVLLLFVYPIGSGPYSSSTTRNAYRLPVGFMRQAPQAPNVGIYSSGAPVGRGYSDWQFEGNYFTSEMTDPIPLRFAADVLDPNQWDPMFLDGFASRLSIELCEVLTQDAAKLKNVVALYSKFMTEARTVNGIETGPVDPPEDTYVTGRQ